MKIDYNKLMYEEISELFSPNISSAINNESNLSVKPRLLLHCCCAPCSSAVIERISKYFDITYYYYNPNTYPESEFIKRRDEFTKLGVKLVSPEYNHNEFLSIVKDREEDAEGQDRCRICILNRMRSSFKYALDNGFDVVTTTLSISPHKDALYINNIGEQLEKEYCIKYLHADFKKENGYLRSIEICREMRIYRQDYCGCEFSIHQEKK